MSAATPEPTEGAAPHPTKVDALAVAATKAAWRTHAASLTWKEKVAAIERMRERDAVIKQEREAARAQRAAGSRPGVK